MRINRDGSKFWQAYRYLLLSLQRVNTIVFTLYALFCWKSIISKLGKSTCHFSSVLTHKMHRDDFNERARSKRDAAKIRQIGEIELCSIPKRDIAEPNRLQLRQICNSFNGKQRNTRHHVEIALRKALGSAREVDERSEGCNSTKRQASTFERKIMASAEAVVSTFERGKLGKV